jgi:hypothetical protein
MPSSAVPQPLGEHRRRAPRPQEPRAVHRARDRHRRPQAAVHALDHLGRSRREGIVAELFGSMFTAQLVWILAPRLPEPEGAAAKDDQRWLERARASATRQIRGCQETVGADQGHQVLCEDSCEVLATGSSGRARERSDRNADWRFGRSVRLSVRGPVRRADRPPQKVIPSGTAAERHPDRPRDPESVRSAQAPAGDERLRHPTDPRVCAVSMGGRAGSRILPLSTIPGSRGQ